MANNVSDATVLILTPVGRDAAACTKLIDQTGMFPQVCRDVSDLIAQLERHADVALIAEEALYGKAIASLEVWVTAQPPWSDMPFVVLTNRNEGERFAQFRGGLVRKLRNVAFLERPLQAISLQAAVLTAGRGRSRHDELVGEPPAVRLEGARPADQGAGRRDECPPEGLRRHPV